MNKKLSLARRIIGFVAVSYTHLMTDAGTFVINGAERAIVSQLVRSPGVFYGHAKDKVGNDLSSATMNPNRGAWLEYETDAANVFYVRIDKHRQLPVTVLCRARCV